jgi:hypothetical protein
MKNYTLMAVVMTLVLAMTCGVFAGDKKAKGKSGDKGGGVTVNTPIVGPVLDKVEKATDEYLKYKDAKKQQKEAEENWKKQQEFAKQKKKEIIEKQKKAKDQKDHPVIPVVQKPPSKKSSGNK